MTNPLLTDERESPAVTFAEPGSQESFGTMLKRQAREAFPTVAAAVDVASNPAPYADIFTSAERSTRLTGNMASESQAREEAYDRRIAAVKAATGIELENPERGGYAIDARKAIRDEVRARGMQSIDATGGVPEYQRRLFDQKLADLQKDHPDLAFGDLDAEARTLAKGASDAAAVAAAKDVNPIAGFAAGFAGGTVGSRRDPLFIGSLFFGPTSAVGRTALARIASASLFTGLYNAGMSAVEQPAVQDWRAKIGMESGVIPAMEDVGLAFALGLIPGAAFQGVKEGLATPLRRVLAGHPAPGDIDAVHAGLTPSAPREAAALASGAESTAADQATLTIPKPKDVAPELHDDMMAAALKRADDPSEPAPEALAATRAAEGKEPGKAPDSEIEQRIRAANPQSQREAIEAADQALDDIGRREGMATLRQHIDQTRGEQAAARAEQRGEQAAARAEQRAEQLAEPPPIPKAAAKDPLGKIPWLDDSGNPKLLTPKAAAAVGERDDLLSMLVRSCK